MRLIDNIQPIAEKEVKAVRKSWKSNDDDELISFSIKVLIDLGEAREEEKESLTKEFQKMDERKLLAIADEMYELNYK